MIVKGYTWEFDGPHAYPEHWMSYNHEMREGLAKLGCKTFDELVIKLYEKLGYKPNVIDFMGGAYFLTSPENTNTLTGIRVHDKDDDFAEAYQDNTSNTTTLFNKIVKTEVRQVLEADILSNEGWKIIRASNVPLADLLVCRPVGPFDIKNSVNSRYDEQEKYIGMYSSLFFRMLELVNKKNGIIFTGLPDFFTDQNVEEFFLKLDKQEQCKTILYTVPDKDYHWGGHQRRYAVIQFSEKKSILKKYFKL